MLKVETHKMKQGQPKIKFYERSRALRPGPTCIDLFAGAGGLAEGFRQAGWVILSGNDVDKHASATFRANFKEASFFEGPIGGLRPATILKDASLKRGELDCLIGGPPCQSFSYNNHDRSASGTRARLFRDYLRIVKALKPKTLLMENVPGMLTISGGRIVEEIRAVLSELGYSCEIKIVYAEDFGVPQERRRAFIVATQTGSAVAVFPRGTHGPSKKPSLKVNPFVHRWEPHKQDAIKPFVTVRDALSDLPILKSGQGNEKAVYRTKATGKYQVKLRGKSRVVRNHVCHKLTDSMLKRISYVPEGGNWTDIPRNLLSAGMKRAKKNCHTKRYGRLARSGLASTLLTKCDPHWGAYIHPTQNRTISVREAARLQGFPDKFIFAGDLTYRHYMQVGNAVPVPLAKALAKSLKRHLSAKGIEINRKNKQQKE